MCLKCIQLLLKGEALTYLLTAPDSSEQERGLKLVTMNAFTDIYYRIQNPRILMLAYKVNGHRQVGI